MKVAALFTVFAATANAFAPATPVTNARTSGSALSMSLERTYIMVRFITLTFTLLVGDLMC